jgi:hypothetical protein
MGEEVGGDAILGFCLCQHNITTQPHPNGWGKGIEGFRRENGNTILVDLAAQKQANFAWFRFLDRAEGPSRYQSGPSREACSGWGKVCGKMIAG